MRALSRDRDPEESASERGELAGDEEVDGGEVQ